MFKMSPRTFGMLFSAILLVFGCMCFHSYHTQLGQTGWEKTTATITHVEEVHRRSHNGGYFTYYNIYYTYTVDGQAYGGMIDELNRSLPVGDAIDIKYDPDAPDQSTHIIEPAKSLLVEGGILTGIGLLWMGSHVRSIIRKKKEKKYGKPQEDVPY